MATHSSILAWRVPWTEEPGGYSPWSCKELDTIEHQTLSLDVSVRTRDTWSCLYFPSIFPRNLTDPRNKEIIIIIRVKQIGVVIFGVFPSIYAVL